MSIDNARGYDDIDDVISSSHAWHWIVCSLKTSYKHTHSKWFQENNYNYILCDYPLFLFIHCLRQPHFVSNFNAFRLYTILSRCFFSWIVWNFLVFFLPCNLYNRMDWLCAEYIVFFRYIQEREKTITALGIEWIFHHYSGIPNTIENRLRNGAPSFVLCGLLNYIWPQWKLRNCFFFYF